MKVLHVYRTYFPASQGGLEETIRQICLSTNSAGVETRVLAPIMTDGPKVVRYAGSRVYQPRANFEIASCTVSMEFLGMFRRLADWADIIHYHFPWPFADIAHFWVRPDRPTILTYHSDIVRQRALYAFYRPLMNRFLGSVDRIVCSSPNYFVTSNVLSRYENKVDVIPFGIDRNTYPEPPDAMEKEIKQSYGAGYFLFVGVLRYYKGLHILLEALQGAPYRVVIVGSGPTEEALKKQARELNLSNVVFTGFVSNEMKVALIKASKAIVFPSYLRAEAFGITLLEGAMYGKPLISTEVGSGTSHVNVAEETGLVVTPASPRSFRKAMDRLHYDSDLALKMGANAKARFEQHFTSDQMGRKYIKAYKEVLRAWPDRSPLDLKTTLPRG